MIVINQTIVVQCVGKICIESKSRNIINRKHPGFPCNQFGAQEPGTAEEVLFKNLPFSYLLLILFVQIGKRADCSPGVE